MLVVFLTVDSVPSGRVPGAWGDPPQVVVRITRSLTPSVGCRITGGTTSSGSKVTGIPQAQPSCFWSAAPHPWLSSQLFELCLSFPASPSPEKKKKLKRQTGRTHTKFYWGGVFTEAGRREGVTWGGGDCGYKADDGIQNDPCIHPNPRKGGRAAGAQKTGWGRIARS